MQCPSCGHENRDSASFCGQCAASLVAEVACSACGTTNPLGQRFCDSCAAPLGQALTQAPTVEAPFAPVRSPASFANGRYQVKEFLGEGGRKRVYQAHDTVLDRDVALAVIKTEGLDPTSRVRITREAQAMGRLGDHPHVLSIHDLGDEAGQPYMVLPLMPGGDVGTLLEAAEDHRLSVEQAIDLAMQVCRGLEFAHSKGIVHRDLKPGNVWLTSDGTARIGDFGLAVAIDRSRLTQEGMMVGTVSYMPPEQAMGGEVTPQSDLYSLGAMLYEMVTGRPPFLGDDSVAIIGQHINTPPVAPTWHNSECPRALEALIMRLLAKNPRERPASASDVLTALEGIDLTVDVGADEHDEAHALDSLAGGVFVGRQREMGELKAALEDALSGRGRLVTVVGEPGIGKTRTAQELATYAGLRGCQVLWGRCHESRGAPPYWPWVQAIRSYVRERDPERLRSEMGTGAADIAEIVSDVRERIPDLKPSPAVDDPEQARFRLFDSITAFLKTASRGQPLVVILDNLHWADKPSLLLLEFLAQELADSRLLVIGTYRDVDLSRQHPLVETLGELTREHLFQRVLLRGLSQDDVGRFIEITSGITPPRGLVRAVHTQTEGNPLFVTEVVRLLVQEGELSQERARERDSWEVRIPEGVREVIGRRLNRLSARCNETLTIASVIGRVFQLNQLRPLVDDTTEDRLLEVIEEALSARVIVEVPRSVGRYEFTHALIRQTLEDELTTTRRVRLNARIARALEEVYGDDAQTHAVELAYHFAEAEAELGAEKLVRYSVLAGEQALESLAFDEALPHFQRALAAVQGSNIDDVSASAHAGAGFACGAVRDVKRAISHFQSAFDFFAESGDLANVAKIASYRFVSAEGLRGMASMQETALDLLPSDSLATANVLMASAAALGAHSGEYERGKEALQKVTLIARARGNDSLEFRAQCELGYIQIYNLDREGAHRSYTTGLHLAPKVDEPLHLAYLHQVLGSIAMDQGDRVRMRSHSEGSLDAAFKARDKERLSTVHWTAGLMEYLQGRWEEARAFLETSLAHWPDDLRTVSTYAVLEMQTGNSEKGAVYLKQAIDQTDTYEGSGASSISSPALTALICAHVSGNPLPDAVTYVGPRSLEERAGPLLTRVMRATTHTWTAISQVAVPEISEAYDDLVRYTNYDHYDCWTWLLPTQLTLGLAAQLMTRYDAAELHFQTSLDRCLRSTFRPGLAWTAYHYADMLLEREEEGDRQKAATLLDESLAISSELGMRPLVERVLSRKMSLQGIDISSPQTSIDAVVSVAEVERPNLQPHVAPDGTVTVMFTDIEGSTAMTERLGDQKAREVLRIHNAIIRQQVAAHQGFEVKSQGDGFMLAFSSARRALQCAIAIQQTLVAHNAENPGEPIRVRIGLHTGEAIKEGEDFFGKSVILAARIASQAVGGQTLVSSLLKALVESSGEFEFDDGRDVELKGLSGTHQVFGIELP